MDGDREIVLVTCTAICRMICFPYAFKMSHKMLVQWSSENKAQPEKLVFFAIPSNLKYYTDWYQHILMELISIEQDKYHMFSYMELKTNKLVEEQYTVAVLSVWRKVIDRWWPKYTKSWKGGTWLIAVKMCLLIASEATPMDFMPFQYGYPNINWTRMTPPQPFTKKKL